jgi:hypothetical protein
MRVITERTAIRNAISEWLYLQAPGRVCHVRTPKLAEQYESMKTLNPDVASIADVETIIGSGRVGGKCDNCGQHFLEGVQWIEYDNCCGGCAICRECMAGAFV